MQNNTNLSNFIGLKEAAKISGYHQDYLSSLIRSHKLFGQRIGRTWCTTEKAVRDYMGEDKETSAGKTAAIVKVPRYGSHLKFFFYLFVVLFFLFFSYFFVTKYISLKYDKKILINHGNKQSKEEQVGDIKVSAYSMDSEGEIGITIQPTTTKQ